MSNPRTDLKTRLLEKELLLAQIETDEAINQLKGD